VENVSEEEVREKGWYGILEDFKNSVGNKEDFERMRENLEKYVKKIGEV
jgi:hypothetical protein